MGDVHRQQPKILHASSVRGAQIFDRQRRPQMKSERSFRVIPTDSNTFNPRLFGRSGAVATSHYLSSNAGSDILKRGGNAVDAMVGAVLVENLVNPQMNSFGGECPILIYLADQDKVVSINGNMAAPAAATPALYLERGYTDVPDEGALAAGVPATPGSLITALMHYGTMSFAEVADNALELADEGWPLSVGIVEQKGFGIRAMSETFRQDWPASADLFLKNGNVPAPGSIIANPAFADVLTRLIEAELQASGSRQDRLKAVYKEIYGGWFAKEYVACNRQRGGVLSVEDFQSYETFVEEPRSIEFEGYQLFKCGFWTQGPVALQTLSILKHFDVRSLGHNSVEYLHLLIESMKLAFADREQYYGDENHIDLPPVLLSDEYGRIRASLIDQDRADATLRPGDPKRKLALLPKEEWQDQHAWGPGTVHVDIVDASGNMVAATPSGAWLKAGEIIPALGIPFGNRMMTFYLTPEKHPNVVAPGKRPRTTISPSLAFKDGKPAMVFGTMGGDQQEQWQIQFFLNRVLFGMTIQEAIEAPKFSTDHFPGFFAPHTRLPLHVRIEPRVGSDVIMELSRRGHKVEIGVDWSEGFLLGISRDPETGVLEAGFDPRGSKSDVFPCYAQAW
ncbi:gamma-glutamyltranspeptidase/glutathione hydrolase [Aminobacter aminovorans]|nr:gamma-glutamyltransferase family protein [Aminobacter aminovorans]MBB3704726.1 gamma-glutamyltranspeptidase/glutathione hydrolase [Aminobacter aminovorans]